MLRALIFDVDGTLADTERDGHRIAFNRAFADAGLDWNWDVPRYGELLRVAGGRERILHFMDSDAVSIAASKRESLARELHASKTIHYLRMVNDGAVRLRPGVSRLLSEAHAAGLKLAIATTTTRSNVDALLKHALPAGAREWFSAIAAAEDAPTKKPDPSVYTFALGKLDLPVSDCFAFEDTHGGLCAATAAGLRCIVTVNDYTQQQDFTGAFTVLSDFGEPDMPARSLAGAPLDRDYVDIAQLCAWHASASARTT